MRSKAIPDEVIIVAAKELADYTRKEGTLSENHILPTMMDWEIYPLIASVVGEKCVEMGVARLTMTRKQIHDRAKHVIEKSKKMITSAQKANLIESFSLANRRLGKW